jgi:hypothetical protein
VNQADISRIVTAGHAVAAELDRHGRPLLVSTHDWQSPLRSGGAKGPKNQHADPTYTAASNPDALALEHAALVADIQAWHNAGLRLGARLRRLQPLDPNQIERGRVSTVPACIACSGPAPRCRRGLCDACYTAWIRAERPDMHRFRLDRRAELEPPEREHVDPTVPLGNARNGASEQGILS